MGIPEKNRRALLVGIDSYESFPPLNCCVNDARAMADLVGLHHGQQPNYKAKLLTSNSDTRITRPLLRNSLDYIFGGFTGDVLFYFAGHGIPLEGGGFICTQDGIIDDPGLPMDEMLARANACKANSVIIIMDCCHSGKVGDPSSLPAKNGDESRPALLRSGLTILASSRPTETSDESPISGHGVFTELVISALKGEAADVRGHVTVGSVYSFVDQGLGAEAQRPVFKSNVDYMPIIRRCEPVVSDQLLYQIDNPIFFESEESLLDLGPSYVPGHAEATIEDVATMRGLEKLQEGRLVESTLGRDLHYTANRRASVRLTRLGRFYWRMVREKKTII